MGGGEKTAVAFVYFGEGGGCQEAKVTGGEILTSDRHRVKEWRGSLSGCWSYCGGRTGWTGNGQLKLFNPHFNPPPLQDKTRQVTLKVSGSL